MPNAKNALLLSYWKPRSGPLGEAFDGYRGWDMTQPWRRPASRAGTAALVAVLLWSGPALAQSASGPLDFLGNIFGSKSKTDQTGTTGPVPSPAPGGPQ